MKKIINRHVMNYDLDLKVYRQGNVETITLELLEPFYHINKDKLKNNLLEIGYLNPDDIIVEVEVKSQAEVLLEINMIQCYIPGVINIKGGVEKC